MRRLLCSLPKPVRFIDAIDPNEKFDFQSALLSLPRGFRTTLDTIPRERLTCTQSLTSLRNGRNALAAKAFASAFAGMETRSST